MIHGNPGQSAEIKRSDGAYTVLEKYPDMTLLAEDTAHWSEGRGDGSYGKLDSVLWRPD